MEQSDKLRGLDLDLVIEVIITQDYFNSYGKTGAGIREIYNMLGKQSIKFNDLTTKDYNISNMTIIYRQYAKKLLMDNSRYEIALNQFLDKYFPI